MHITRQQDLFQHHHSEELELFFKASQSYDWHRIEKEIGPSFKEAAERSYKEAFQAVRFVSAGLGRNSGVLGAAAYALQEMRKITS